jgi:predicted transposase YbfD/YdcC
LDKASKKAAIYRVSAWAQQNNLVLGQVKVDDKANEITAIPKLLSRLDIAGAVITIDAMGCQKKIAEQIKQHSNRTRKGHSAANLAVIRHIALNLIKAEKTSKVGEKSSV